MTAVITGAGRGLGLAFAKAILAGGGRVLMTDVDQALVQASCRCLQDTFGVTRVQCIQQDVCTDGSFELAFDAAKRFFPSHHLNVLINNAGIAMPYMSFYQDETSVAWRKLIEINVMAVMRGTQVEYYYFVMRSALKLLRLPFIDCQGMIL